MVQAWGRGRIQETEAVCHHITVTLFSISRHGVLHGKLGRGGFGEQGKLKGDTEEWTGDEQGETHRPLQNWACSLPCSITLCLARALGGRESLFLLCKWTKKTN